MKSIPIAQKKEFHEESPHKGQFTIEPLYPGYGLTLGNALRRVLLSSLEGVAITSVRLKGVDHEFSTLEGVREDVVDIILNLKQVRFEVSGEFEEPIKLTLSAKGVKEIKAGDFKKVAGVKIANPELIITNSTDAKAAFELEAWIERGRGYLPTEMMENKSAPDNLLVGQADSSQIREKEVNVIAIDAIFSPVKKVAIDTQNVRVGEMTNWDRLILDLETDGTISPEDALKKSAQILVDQFSFLLESKKVEKKETKEPKSTRLPARQEKTEEPFGYVQGKQKQIKKTEEEKGEEVGESGEIKEDEKVEEKPKKRGRPKKSE